MTQRLTKPSKPSRQDLLLAGTACTVCGRRLSAYNDNSTCWAHTLELPWKGPNHRPR